MRIQHRVLIALAIAGAAVGCGQHPPAGNQPRSDGLKTHSVPSAATTGCLITPESMGPVRLGMKLGEVKTALPDASFERVTDGDGAVFVAVQRTGRDYLTLFANEEDETAPIDWNRPVTHIESFTSECRTREGIGAGTPVVEVERHYGKVIKIERSEIESREFITFAHPPEGLVFRLDYTGKFEGESRETTKYDPSGKIFSISIHHWE